jgi:hypothetical protein
MKRHKFLFTVFGIVTFALFIAITQYTVKVHHRLTETTEDLFASLPVKADDQIEIDKDLVPYFNIFMEDAATHNCDVDRMYKVQAIGFDKSVGKMGCQGVTSMFKYEDTLRGMINFRERLFLTDSIGFLFVMYHEFGHWLGLEHDEIQMMKRSYTTEDDKAWLEKNWGEIRDEYFATLNKHHKHKTN